MLKEKKSTKGTSYNSHGLGTYIKRKVGNREWHEWRIKQDGVVRGATAKTKSELDAKIKKILGTSVKGSKISVDSWFQNWLENYVQELRKDATYQQYKFLYDKHVKPYLGKIRLTAVKQSDVQAVIIRMNKSGLSSATMGHVRKILHVGYERAIDIDKLLEKNPVYKIDIPKKQAKPLKVLTSEELSLIFDSMKNSRWIWSAKFDLVTALRRGELLATKWKNVEILNKRILIEESDSSNGLGDTKGAKSRYVPLSDMAIKYLEEQQFMLENELNKNKELVFPNQKGDLMNPRTYYKTFARYANRVGVKASPHMMRHTFVYFTRGTIDLKDLQNILGHSKSTQTLDMYGDMISDKNNENIKAIDSAFKSVGKEIKKAKITQMSSFKKNKKRA